MKSMLFEGETWIKLKDAPQYCEVNWGIIIKQMRKEAMPDDPAIALKKFPKVIKPSKNKERK